MPYLRVASNYGTFRFASATASHAICKNFNVEKHQIVAGLGKHLLPGKYFAKAKQAFVRLK